MEKWDLYNAKREKTGLTMQRGENIPKGLYHLVVSAWIVNQQGQYLFVKLHCSHLRLDFDAYRIA